MDTLPVPIESVGFMSRFTGILKNILGFGILGIYIYSLLLTYPIVEKFVKVTCRTIHDLVDSLFEMVPHPTMSKFGAMLCGYTAMILFRLIYNAIYIFIYLLVAIVMYVAFVVLKI